MLLQRTLTPKIFVSKKCVLFLKSIEIIYQIIKRNLIHRDAPCITTNL